MRLQATTRRKARLKLEIGNAQCLHTDFEALPRNQDALLSCCERCWFCRVITGKMGEAVDVLWMRRSKALDKTRCVERLRAMQGHFEPKLVEKSRFDAICHVKTLVSDAEDEKRGAVKSDFCFAVVRSKGGSTHGFGWDLVWEKRLSEGVVVCCESAAVCMREWFWWEICMGAERERQERGKRRGRPSVCFLLWAGLIVLPLHSSAPRSGAGPLPLPALALAPKKWLATKVCVSLPFLTVINHTHCKGNAAIDVQYLHGPHNLHCNTVQFDTVYLAISCAQLLVCDSLLLSLRSTVDTHRRALCTPML